MSEASVGPSKPYRHTKGEWSKEHSKASYRWKQYGKRPMAWCGRRARPMVYHPVAAFGTAGFIYTYFWVSHWVPAIVGMYVSLVWPLVHPDSYMRHMEWRGPSFLQGLKIRYMPRRKYMGAKVLNKEEKLIAADRIRKVGDTTVVVFTLPFGDTVPQWQERAADLASAFGKLKASVNPFRKHTVWDLRPTGNFRFKLHPARAWHGVPTRLRLDFACKPDLLRRPPFVQLAHTGAKRRKPRAVEITFLDREPFLKPVSVDWLNLHRPMNIHKSAGPTGKDERGLPYFEDDRLSCLWVAITGGGKTNTLRCMLFADWERVQAKLVENWGCDLSPGGVELRPMEGQFARTAYGLDPQKVFQFWRDLRTVMVERMEWMGDNGVTYFVESEDHPLVNAYLDEARLLKLPEFDAVRGEIYRDMSAVLTNGRKAGVKIRAFTQTVKLENFAPRDDFPRVKPGILRYRRHVDMVVGEGSWASGMQSDQLDWDTPGIYYEAGEGLRAPIELRYGDVPFGVIQELPRAPKSFLEEKPAITAHEPTYAERASGLQIVKR